MLESTKNVYLASNLKTIDDILIRVKTLLPEQGPIDVFVHHNTLHHFEDELFEDAVEGVARRVGAEPYMAHADYLKAYSDRRIDSKNLSKIVAKNISKGVFTDQILPDLEIEPKRYWKKLILIPKVYERVNTINHLFNEGDLLKVFSKNVSDFSREQIRNSARATYRKNLGSEEPPFNGQLDEYALKALYDAILEKKIKSAPPVVFSVRPAEVDTMVNRRLITFLNSYADQGIAYWEMPQRSASMLKSFLKFVKSGEKWAANSILWVDQSRGEQLCADLDQNIENLLLSLGVVQLNWPDFIESELLKLSGWSGTVSIFEEQPELLTKTRPFSLKELLLIRLLLLEKFQSESSFREEVFDEFHAEDQEASIQLELFHFMQAIGFDAEKVSCLPQETWNTILKTLMVTDDSKRRRVLHQAYESTHRSEIIDSIALNIKRTHPQVSKVKYQALFCIDDREESLRRHLEEIQPSCETYGVAGFFGLDVLYKGLKDKHPIPLCPVSVKPTHLVEEIPLECNSIQHKKSETRAAMINRWLRKFYDHSREIFGGAVFTIIGGILSGIPMMFRIRFPRLTGYLVDLVRLHFFPKTQSELTLFAKTNSGELSGKTQIGYTDSEMAERVFNLLLSMGIENFSRIIFVIGHGSSSLNNPHESAHDCGACGGRRGGPNGRMFADMANRQSVRILLSEMGLNIPAETFFVGGYHDTCSDRLEFFNLDAAPESIASDLHRSIEDFDRAITIDAHERCRRFEDAKHFSPTLALKHVQGRSQNLREPRPEYGHCTNAICVVGRREITKGLFLDRRAFLVSYNPKNDPEATILSSLMGAITPVCAGINLEYYFSFVDNEKYGCGTKLPHNVTGLIGVMNGGLSDIRTGLPWQMVEIHEPVRLVTLVEATVKQMDIVLKGNNYIKNLVLNRWIQLGCICPDSNKLYWFETDGFVEHKSEINDLNQFSTSKAYYQGKSEHLRPALITRRGS